MCGGFVGTDRDGGEKGFYTLLFLAFVSFLKRRSYILPTSKGNYFLLVIIVHQLGIHSAPITSEKSGVVNRSSVVVKKQRFDAACRRKTGGGCRYMNINMILYIKNGTKMTMKHFAATTTTSSTKSSSKRHIGTCVQLMSALAPTGSRRS